MYRSLHNAHVFQRFRREHEFTTPPSMQPSKKEVHIALHMPVGQYVGIPQICATYNWITLYPIDFELDTHININMKMIAIAWHVSGSNSRPFSTLLSVLQVYLVKFFKCAYFNSRMRNCISPASKL